jgi:hypothetical protein
VDDTTNYLFQGGNKTYLGEILGGRGWKRSINGKGSWGPDTSCPAVFEENGLFLIDASSIGLSMAKSGRSQASIKKAQMGMADLR